MDSIFGLIYFTNLVGGVRWWMPEKILVICCDRTITAEETQSVDRIASAEAHPVFRPIQNVLWIETAMTLDSLMNALSKALPKDLKFFGYEAAGSPMTCRMGYSAGAGHWPKGVVEICPVPPPKNS